MDFIKTSMENNDLEAINTLLEGRTKCNSIQKAHFESFRKIIELMSKELDWSETKVTTGVESKPETQGNSITEEEQKRQVWQIP